MPIVIREKIRAIRIQKGLSAKEVAESIGISRPYYTQLELGSRRLSAEHVQNIAIALDVLISELYGERKVKIR